MAEPKAPDLTGRPRLNWHQAVEAMRCGKFVRRASHMHKHSDGPRPGVYDTGHEGIFLAPGWTVDEKPEGSHEPT